jgi:succinyl-CoA synthetase beta subunit
VAKLLEHQGKDLLRQAGISTPAGCLVYDLEEARAAAAELGYPVMVKAQIYAGKRGKAGGIRPAACEEELLQVAADMFSCSIRGHSVTALLLEQQVQIDQELYVGVAADPAARAPALMVCESGGMEIEEVVAGRPEALHKWPVDILRGVQIYDALNLLRALDGISSKQKLDLARVLCQMYDVYRRYDCKLLEINPLALTPNGVVALDARLDIDGDALGRQAGLGMDVAEEAGDRRSTLLEQIAGTIDAGDHRGTVHFVQIDPDLSFCREQQYVPVGFDCVGAGVSLTLMDELVPLGYYPVNFCDSSGNPVASKLYRITKVIFSQPGIEGYVFESCVSSQQLDNTARGIIKALKELYPGTGGQPNVPTVLAFRGAWDSDAIKLLGDHGISAGRWVRVLGRGATERDVAHAFHTLHGEWKASVGGMS